jgi:hypothetical protein
LPSGTATLLPNTWPEFPEAWPTEICCEPPPVWKRTYGPLPSKFCPSPESPTSAYMNSL